MPEYAARLTNSQDTIDRVRRVDALGLTPAGNPTQARSGLRPDGGGAVTVNSGQMSVAVSAFSAWIDGGASDAQVGYPMFLDAGKTLAIAAGHATLVRIDTVVAQVRDTAYDGSGSTDARVYVVQGTPGAGAPAVPQSAIPLRDISVHAGASAGTGGLTAANLSTDRRQYVVGLGAVLPVASQAERDALTPQKGTTVYRGDLDQLEVYNGATWRTYAPSTAPVWQTYTPAWTGATNPVLNNGTMVGRYIEIGNLIHFRVAITAGSSTTFGTGQYQVSVPFTAHASGLQSQVTGDAFIGGGAYQIRGRLPAGGTSALLYCDPTTAGGFSRTVTPTTPGTFANGSGLVVQGTYERA